MTSAAAGIPVLMAGFLVKTTLVLALALIAAAAAKKRPAAFRHFLLSAALIGLLLLPLLNLAPVGWRSALVPAWMTPSGPLASDAPAAERRGAVIAKRGSDGYSAGPVRNKGTAGGWSIPLQTGPFEPSPLSSSSGRETPDSLTGSPDRRDHPRAILPGILLALLWSAGLAALVLRLVFGLAGAVRLTAEGTPLRDPAWRVLLERFLALVSLRRQVRLRSHPAVLVPLTWGWRRPVILLPDGADAWTDDERSSALFHELSHIKRADFLVMLLVRTSLALFWWNPLCWIVYRELLKEQEIACDELVLRTGIRPSTYAASLLAFRRSAGFRWNPSAALLGLLGRSSFQERLTAILKQKLTFMEVKMKTKIMLALALVLAVAFVGTARPAMGREAIPETALTVPTETPATASLEATVLPEQTAKVAQATEAEKAKAAKKTVVIKPVVVDGQPIEIVITEGDQVKKLLIDKPLTITKSKNGEAIILTVEGQEAQVLEGEPLRLEIKGGEVMILKEGQPVKIVEGRALKHGEATAFTIVTKGGEESDEIVYSFTPRGHAGAAGKTFTLVKESEGSGGVQVFVGTQKEGKPAIAWTAKEQGDGKAVWVAKSGFGEPAHVTWVAADGHAHSTTDEEMLAKVQALQEQVRAIKAKKLDITALEQSLKKLEAEFLANEEKFKEIQVQVVKEPHQYVVTKKTGDKTVVWVTEKGHAVEADEAKAVVRAAGDGDATINVILTGKKGAEGKKAYERALAELKKRLPEGYKLAGQSYDPENGTMVFGIAAAEGMKTDEAVVRKLVEALQAEIKK